MALKVSAEVPTDYLAMKEELADDKGFCAVIALAAITRLPVKEVADALAAAGRKKRQGTHRSVSKKALEALGFKVTCHGPSWIRNNIIHDYPGRNVGLRSVTTHHPRRFPSAWIGRPDMLLFSTAHVAAFVDGEIKDWAIKHSKKINSIWLIEHNDELIPIGPLVKEGE